MKIVIFTNILLLLISSLAGAITRSFTIDFTHYDNSNVVKYNIVYSYVPDMSNAITSACVDLTSLDNFMYSVRCPDLELTTFPVYVQIEAELTNGYVRSAYKEVKTPVNKVEGFTLN